jgi:threonylcarbamoyladenosine tRNA methylthiotransferase MtaB
VKQPTAAVLTTGCRLNQSESDVLRQRLALQGVAVVEDLAQADTCYVNTCTVTGQADRSSIQMIRRVLRLKPRPRVVVLGCLPERSAERVRLIAGVDEVWDNRRKQAEIAGITPAPARCRAILKVQDGCSRRCSYCVVSGLRGEPRSVPAVEVSEQFRRLAASGFREVVLTGLNLGMYHDRNGTNLAGLVKTLLEAGPVTRIRLASLEPDMVGDDLTALLCEPRVCPHVHLPLQSGDDMMLERMRRPYRTGASRGLIERLRRVRPETNVGADVIVGFPGETDDSFERTRQFISDVRPGYLHVFSFSLRPGTEERCQGEPVPRAVVKERVRDLRDLSNRLRQAYEAGFIGSTRQAVVETARTALTDNYLRLALRCPTGQRPGALVGFHIESDRGRLVGSPC